MRRYIRATAPGGTYFFTLALEDRGSRCLVEHADLLRSAIMEVKAAHPFTSDAMVVMPEHLHAVWTLPPGDADFPTRWMLIKLTFTKEAGKSGRGLAARGKKGERSLWQRRYWEHQIRDEDDFRRHVEYIHFNPVKHGWVQRVRDWPYSSFHRYVREGRVGVDWGLAKGLDGAFGE